jgi:hypothetical protein
MAISFVYKVASCLVVTRARSQGPTLSRQLCHDEATAHEVGHTYSTAVTHTLRLSFDLGQDNRLFTSGRSRLLPRLWHQSDRYQLESGDAAAPFEPTSPISASSPLSRPTFAQEWPTFSALLLLGCRIKASQRLHDPPIFTIE